MSRERSYDFSIELELFFVVFPKQKGNIYGLSFFLKTSIDSKPSISNFNRLLIGFTEVAFGKAEVVDGIQQIGLPLSIGTTDGSHPVWKREFSGTVVPKLEEVDMGNLEQNLSGM